MDNSILKVKTNYNNDLLINHCKTNNIILMHDYINDNINRETIIKANCSMQNCKSIVEKTFRLLIQCGCYCKQCMKLIRLERVKKNCLEKFGVEHALQSKFVKDKSKNTNLEKYGFENPFQVEEIKDKIKSNNFKKYGVEYSSQIEAVKQKKKETFLKNYGNPTQLEYLKQKKKETFLKNYGNPTQLEYLKQKTKETCLKKYGVEHPLQSQTIRDKIEKTCLKKYGVKNPSQNSEILERAFKNSFRLKTYILPSGKIIKYQGYENYALDELLIKINENDLITGTSEVPKIWYNDDKGNLHIHFVDIFIPSLNKCIEVKSTFTLNKGIKKDNIFLKQLEGKKLGYDYEIWVYDGKGKKVECFR
jgi:hypothetical protein